MIIVTGAAGFIGSALIWALNKKGITHILAVDELGTSEKWKNLAPLQIADYEEKDDFIYRIQSEPESFSNVEAVLHMGACSSTTESDASYLIQNNFEFSKHLALFCSKKNARFIYASSAATYGGGENGYSDDEAQIHRLLPLNMYAYSKQLFDMWMRRNNLLEGAVGLKFFNVYGPNEYHKAEMRSMVVKAFNQIRSTGKVKLFKSHRPDFKDGRQMRDFIYIKDVTDMTLHFLDITRPGGLYNIGTGEARTWLDMMMALFKELDQTPDIEFIDMPDVLRGKYQYHTEAEMNKLNKAGYLSKTRSLEQGIADYCNYLKAEGACLGSLKD